MRNGKQHDLWQLRNLPSRSRRASFSREGDNRFFLGRLTELSQQCGGAVHAYGLRTPPVHLWGTPERVDGAPLTMKPWGQCDVQDCNRTDKRRGTLWAIPGAVIALS